MALRIISWPLLTTAIQVKEAGALIAASWNPLMDRLKAIDGQLFYGEAGRQVPLLLL
jgi:hypothetical protein